MYNVRTSDEALRLVFLGVKRDDWNNHFLHRYTAVLECAFIILNVVVVIVRIGKEFVAFSKNIVRRKVGARQSVLFRVAHLKYFLLIVTQIFAYLVAQICVDVLIADNPYRSVYANAAVIGGDEYIVV